MSLFHDIPIIQTACTKQSTYFYDACICHYNFTPLYHCYIPSPHMSPIYPFLCVTVFRMGFNNQCLSIFPSPSTSRCLSAWSCLVFGGSRFPGAHCSWYLADQHRSCGTALTRRTVCLLVCLWKVHPHCLLIFFPFCTISHYKAILQSVPVLLLMTIQKIAKILAYFLQQQAFKVAHQ